MTRREWRDLGILTAAVCVCFGVLPGVAVLAVSWGAWQLVKRADEIGVE